MSFMLLACLVILLHLQPSRGLGVPSSAVCDIQTAYDSPFVEPYYERFDVAAGCVSRENTSNAEEVHVISLVGEGLSHTQDGVPKVILHLQPRDPTSTHQTQLIFVLNAQRPVKWHIQSERINNGTRNLFLISSNSRLVKDGTMRIKIQKVKDMPSDREALATWTRDRYNAITSFTEFTHANAFFKRVGRDESDPPTCSIATHFFSSTSLPTYLEKQAANGCIALQNADVQGRDVHIIELHSAKDNIHNTAVADVVIDIQTEKRNLRQKHIVLILKSHSPVKWAIRTRSIKGTLDIINDLDVDSDGVDMQEVRVAWEQLQRYSGESLIHWVADKYGPPLSYTQAQLANKFDLKVDGADDMIEAAPIVQNDGDSPSSRLPFSVDKSTWQAVHDNMKVICQNRGMEVTLPKHPLQRYGITRDHLTLLNESCPSRSNSTHFILYTNLGECGTLSQNNENVVIFKNAIIVHDIRGLGRMEANEEGSADLESLHGSSTFTDDTHLDDEDYIPSEALTIAFQCHYDTPGIPNPSVSVPLRSSGTPPDNVGSQYELSLFPDDSFKYSERFKSFPHQITEGQTLYVEARITNSLQRLRVVIQDCWLASKKDASEDEGFAFIEQGCRSDNLMQWYDSPGGAASKAERFTLKYMKRRDEDFAVFLRCQLTLCSEDGTFGAPKVKQCTTRDHYCNTQRMVPKSDTSSGLANAATVSLGPLIVMPEGSPPSGCIKDPPPNCGQVVHMEGLDSATVVCIAFAAFIIGVLLTAVLWYIHTHTGPMRKSARPRSNETSGESTPSSTAPITIHQIHA